MLPVIRCAIRTLNVHVPWTEVLPAVGVVSTSSAVPARVRCPVCTGAKLTIYEDTISGGEWHYCFDCHTHGDMVELAAAAWGVAPRAAIRRFSETGCAVPDDRLTPPMLVAYLKQYVDKRKAMTDLWRRMQDYLVKCPSDGLKALQGKFKIASHLSLDRWRAGPGQMVGAYSKAGVEMAFGTAKAKVPQRVFKGSQWTDVLAVPHYDLPGRICGFLFVGRYGREEDSVYKPLSLDAVNGGSGADRVLEGGIGGLWAAYNSRSEFGNNLVATGDPFLALRLQVRNAATADAPLPLVSYYDSPAVRTVTAWQAVDPKRVTFWGWRLTAGLLYQAIISDGNLALSEIDDVTPARVDHYVRDNEPRDIVRRAIKTGKPWQAFLVAWADKVSDGAVADLMIEVEAYDIDFKLLAGLSQRISRFCRSIGRVKNVQLADRKIVIESRGKWWLGETQPRQAIASKAGDAKLVMNATLRIDGTRVAGTGADEVVLYLGRLGYEGEEIAFEIPYTKLLRCPAAELTGVLARHRPGAVLFIAAQWGPRILEAGVRFGQAV